MQIDVEIKLQGAFSTDEPRVIESGTLRSLRVGADFCTDWI